MDAIASVGRATRDHTAVFSPNLAVDHILDVDHIEAGHVHRALQGRLSAGGKGVNVARAGSCIGIRSTVVGFVAGQMGSVLRSLIESEGLVVASPDLVLETRIATILLNRSNGVATVINEPGPTIDREAWTKILDLLLKELATASTLICVGSLPPGTPSNGYGEAIAAAISQGIPVIVDAAGAALRSSAAHKPTLIKANLDETLAAFGPDDPPGLDEGTGERRAMAAAEQAFALSEVPAVVTIAGGAALVYDKGSLFFRSPGVRVHNQIGAGDSFLAGLAARLSTGADLVEACRWGIAVATASVETDQPGRLEHARALDLERMVTVADYSS